MWLIWKCGVAQGDTFEDIVCNNAEHRARWPIKTMLWFWTVIALDMCLLIILISSISDRLNILWSEPLLVENYMHLDVGFLKHCLWIPTLRKDVITESQLTTEDHLSKNIFRTDIMDLSNIRSQLILQQWDVAMRRFLLIYLHMTTILLCFISKESRKKSVSMMKSGVVMTNLHCMPVPSILSKARHSLILARNSVCLITILYSSVHPLYLVLSECIYYSTLQFWLKAVLRIC